LFNFKATLNNTSHQSIDHLTVEEDTVISCCPYVDTAR